MYFYFVLGEDKDADSGAHRIKSLSVCNYTQLHFIYKYIIYTFPTPYFLLYREKTSFTLMTGEMSFFSGRCWGNAICCCFHCPAIVAKLILVSSEQQCSNRTTRQAGRQTGWLASHKGRQAPRSHLTWKKGPFHWKYMGETWEHCCCCCSSGIIQRDGWK